MWEIYWVSCSFRVAAVVEERASALRAVTRANVDPEVAHYVALARRVEVALVLLQRQLARLVLVVDHNRVGRDTSCGRSRRRYGRWSRKECTMGCTWGWLRGGMGRADQLHVQGEAVELLAVGLAGCFRCFRRALVVNKSEF